MSSAREAQGRKKLFVQDIELLRRTAQTGTGELASAARHFSYVLRYLDESDIPAIVELHGTIVGSLPNRLLLYRRDRPFFTACIERVCVAVAFDGDRAIGYAASSIPATDEENYGADLGLGPDQLTHVAHLSGSAVLPEYRGNGIQARLLHMRAAFMHSAGFHHQCGEVLPRNVISIQNHLAAGYYLKGFRIDDFRFDNKGVPHFLLHTDTRAEHLRADAPDTEFPAHDLERYRQMLRDGYWGYRIHYEAGTPRLACARFTDRSARR